LENEKLSLSVLGFELQALHLLGRHSNPGTIPPAHINEKLLHKEIGNLAVTDAFRTQETERVRFPGVAAWD
jgi:hypothetical protein